MRHTSFAAANNLPDQGRRALFFRSPRVHGGQDPLPHEISVGMPQLCLHFAQFGLVKVFETAGALADCEGVRVIRQKPILATRLREPGRSIGPSLGVGPTGNLRRANRTFRPAGRTRSARIPALTPRVSGQNEVSAANARRQDHWLA